MNHLDQTRTVHAPKVPAVRTADGPLVRVLLDAGLRRCLIEVPPGAKFTGTGGAAGELWFVVSGHGALRAGQDQDRQLGPDLGVWMPASLAYQVLATEDEDLRLDVVTLPEPPAVPGPGAGGPVIRQLGDCPVEVTGDRKFRVLFGPGRDCAVATQFVGEIPPGRAPDHSHPYDETVLILQGTGWLHAGGADHPLAPGTCTRLPPGLPHCLENTGTSIMRLLGVFHPADSPAAKLDVG